MFFKDSPFPSVNVKACVCIDKSARHLHKMHCSNDRSNLQYFFLFNSQNCRSESRTNSVAHICQTHKYRFSNFNRCCTRFKVLRENQYWNYDERKIRCVEKVEWSFLKLSFFSPSTVEAANTRNWENHKWMKRLRHETNVSQSTYDYIQNGNNSRSLREFQVRIKIVQ